MPIKIKAADFKPSDAFGLYREKAFSPISGTAPKPLSPEEQERERATTEVTQRNQATTQSYEQLNTAEPGRYQLVDETALSDWQTDWQARQPGFIEDTARIFGGAVVEGTGSIVQGLGHVVQSIGNTTTTPIINNIFGTNYGQANPLAAPAEWLDNMGEKTKEGMSFATKEAIANSTPDGDILNPATWTLGKAPSLAGYAALTLDVFGQMAPVLLAAVAGPVAGAAVGGAQGGGAASQQANDLIDQMASEPGLLEKESAYYREQIAAGVPHDAALAATKNAAGQAAFWFTAPISALGGAATSKIIDPANNVLAGKAITQRILGRAALSGLEEGTQEAAESIATKAGLNAGAGMDQSLTEGTFADFMLGALAGSPAGGAAGAFSKREGVASDAPVAQNGPSVAQNPGSETQTPPTVAPTATVAPGGRPAGVLTRARDHGIATAPDAAAGVELVVNDPPLPGQGAGMLHGQTVRVSPNQTGIDPTMLNVMGEDGIEQLISKRVLQDTTGAKLVPDPQGLDAPLETNAGRDTLAPAGSRVMVAMPGSPSFTARIESWVETPEGREALIITDDGESLQVPSNILQVSAMSKLQREQEDLRENPPLPPTEPIERTGKVRELPNAQGEPTNLDFPDDTLAQLFDLGRARATTKGLERATGGTPGLAMDMFDPEQTKALADKLGVRPETLGAIADDYQYKAMRAARTGSPKYVSRMHGLDDKQLKAWRNERTKAEGGEVSTDADDAADWWDNLPLGARKVTLAAANVLRNEKTGWSQFGKGVQNKLRIVRGEFDAINGSKERTRAFDHTPELDIPAPEPEAEIAPRPRQDPPAVEPAEFDSGTLEWIEENGATADMEALAEMAARSRIAREQEKQSDPADWTPAQRKAYDAGDTRRFSELRGYTADEIENHERFLDLANDMIEKYGVDFVASMDLTPELEGPAAAIAAKVEAKEAAIDAAAAEAATSPENDRPEPTEAQKEAGNYKVGHATLGGLSLSIENPAGSERKGKDKSGKPWSVWMESHYGYIKGTVGKDKDHIDVFVKPGTAELAGDAPVFVVDQVQGASFDEHKVMLGFDTIDDAREAYLENYSKGWKGLGDITATTLDEFKGWLAAGNTSGRFGNKSSTSTPSETPANAEASEASGPVEAKATETSPVAADIKLEEKSADYEKPKGWREIGENVAGEKILQAPNGKRARIDKFSGKRINETVRADRSVENFEPTITEAEALEARGLDIAPLAPEPQMAGATTPTPAGGSTVFPPAENTVNFKTAEHELLTPDQAKAKLAEWKQFAQSIGKTQDHSNEVILSLFDASGSWSKPWRDAGYTVVQFDAQLGDDAFYDSPLGVIDDAIEGGKRIVGVLAATPCTTFAGSGARWWESRHDVADREMVQKLFGPKAAQLFDTPVDANRALVHLTEVYVELATPEFHVMENPIGRLAEMTGLGAPQMRFDPNNFGDAYTKRTQLWGKFSTDLPTANVDPVDGSKMQSKLSSSNKFERSLTPEGFSYSFFMAQFAQLTKTQNYPKVIEAKANPVPAKDEHPGLVIKNLRTGKETVMQPKGTTPPKAGKPAKVESEWKPIGKNAKGFPIYEDQNGVRSYVEGGVRLTESVRVQPDGGFYVDTANRWSDYKPVEAKTPFPLDQAIEAGGATKPYKAWIQTASDADLQDMTRYGLPGMAAQSELDRRAAAPAPEAPADDAFAKNTLFTADKVAAARARLKSKMNQFNSGVDPEMLIDGMTIAGAYIEAGVRDFSDYAERMVEDFGDAIKPFLLSFWEGARNYPGLDTKGMSPAKEAARIHSAMVAGVKKTATVAPKEAPDGSGSTEPQDRAGSGDGDVRGATELQPEQRPAPRDNRDLEAEQPGDVAKPAKERAGRADSARPATADVGRTGAADGAGDGLSGRDGTSARAPDADAGSRAGSGTGTGISVVKAPKSVSPANTGPGNFHIADPLAIVGGGQVARFEKNKRALETINTLRDEGRQATREEQEVLAGWTGWGSFGQDLFQGTWDRPQPKQGWEARDKWLRENVGQAEWQSLQNSIINAHYTDPPTVTAMWDMVQRMGFNGGRVLEPSMGIGNFFGMMPKELQGRSKLTGIELEQLTGDMAKQLYPDANINIMGYQDSKTPDGFYDLVIGNWPFADIKMADRRWNRLSPLLHDYFYLKALSQTRAGGLVIGITSHGTLDKKESVVRTEMAKQGELVAAFRLPSGAFQEYAGTKVVTDIIILRKREAPLANASDAGWIKSVDYKTPTGPSVSINEYFVANPSHVIGTTDFGHGTTSMRPGMIVHRPADMMDQLKRITALVPEGAYQPDRSAAKQISYITNHTADREGALTKTKDGFFIVRGEQLAPAGEVNSYAIKDAKVTADREAQLDTLIDMRKAYAELITAERTPDSKPEPARKALKKIYDAFTAKHGPVSDSFGLDYLRKIRDPFYPSLAALENKGKPAGILTQSTMRAPPSMVNPSIADAFVLARNSAINPSLAQIAEIAKKSPDEVKAELIGKGAIYELPGGDIVPADIYLSGNVREKMRQAKGGLEAGNQEMQRNIDALAKVIPADVPYYNIEVQFGAPWVPLGTYGQYVAHMLNVEGTDGIDVTYTAGRWRVQLTPHLKSRPEARAGNFATSEYDFGKLLNAAISNQTVTIRTKPDADGNTTVDAAATAEVNAKITTVRSSFGEWLWSEPERRIELEAEYNEVRNAFASPSFDGSFLSFEGMALSLGRGPFDLRKHQQDAIWRALVMRRSLNAHEVGTGKTFTMGGIAVESRRYGIAKKPLILAHNANSKSVAAEIQEMYPGAKVLYIDNLAPADIDVKMRQIANDDWDAVVVPHSLIDRFSLTEETLMKLAAEEIAAIESEAYAAAADDGVKLDDKVWDITDAKELAKAVGRSPTAKDLVKLRNRIVESIKKQGQRAARENAVSFEDLGVDMVLVDEVHEFKKPPFSTRMKMKGLNTAASDKSIALSFLTKYIRSTQNGGNVHLFTGTPVTNTLTEVFHASRYIMAEEMADMSVDQWDGWFGSFAKEVQDVELNAAAEYEAVTRLAGFINVPELRRMIGQYMDVVFADDMPEMQPRRTPSGKLLNDKTLTKKEEAFLLNGRTENAMDRPYKKVIVETADLTPAQAKEFAQIQGYAQAWRSFSGKEKKDAMAAGSPESPIITEGLAAKASYDVRLLDSERLAGREGKTKDDQNSKASRVIKNLVEIYKSSDMATQVVFTGAGLSKTAEQSVSDGDGNKSKRRYKVFATAYDIIERLVQQGIPREQIALVDGSTSKDKRKAIADAMNRAEIRIVIGSTQSLGVGVNMQRNLRAMHHMDAPWMPGDLEQRNGRGMRQGNQWNTVLEYRYLTDRIDGRRWQILAIKQRFISAFLKADDKTRIIEGDAAADEENDILTTFAEAAGDPRVLIRVKLQKKIEQFKQRLRLHDQGTVDAARSAAGLKDLVVRLNREIKQLAPIADKIEALSQKTAGEGFQIHIKGSTYSKRPDAKLAIEDAVNELDLGVGDDPVVLGKFGGYELSVGYPRLADNWILSLDVDGEKVAGKSPSLQSLEAALRAYRDGFNSMQPEVADAERSITRLQAQAQEPFHQAAEMARVEADYKALEADLKANPVPPPSWLRSGAPIDTEVVWNGETRLVSGHRWNKDGWYVLTSGGDDGAIAMPYTEVTDQQGMPVYDERPFVSPIVEKPKDPNASVTLDPAAPVPTDVDLDARQAPEGWGSVENLPEQLRPDEIENLNTIVRQVAGLSKVEWRQRIVVEGGNWAWGTDTRMEAAGFYDPHRDVIALTTQWGNPATAYHEAFHRLQWAFLTDKERKALASYEAEFRDMIVKSGRRTQEATALMALSELEADAFGVWAAGLVPEPSGFLARVWRKIRNLRHRSINALLGMGYQIPQDIFTKALNGEIAARKPLDREQRRSGKRTLANEWSMAPELDAVTAPGAAAPAKSTKPANARIQNIKDEIKGLFTDMQPSTLALVPLNYFQELKRPGMVAVDQYLKTKRLMDAYRGDKHAAIDTVAQEWRKYARLGRMGMDKAKAAALADLMHESTLAGVDPSSTVEEVTLKAGYDALRAKYLALSPSGQALFRRVRDTYRDQANELDDILLDNVRKTQEIALRRAEDNYRDQLEAIAENTRLSDMDRSKAKHDAQQAFANEANRAKWNMKARMTKLRTVFEASRVPEPYFPLSRFGQYYVTVRDVDGTVLSFSKREKEADRIRLERDMRAAFPNHKVESGKLAESGSARTMMDPRIVAEIETLLGDMGVDSKVMDMVWQRYLETMPDLSARKRFIHRKGVAGFEGDALRTFASAQFHAAHQMARLKYGIELTELANQATDQAKKADQPVKAMQLADELGKRHEWVMNPQGNAVANAATQAMFVWHLAATPAAAVLNLTQTPMMGIPVLGARLGGIGKATAAIGKASTDLVKGRGTVRNAGLTAEETRAMEAFYESGMIERSQGHDLAGIGETGIGYSPLRFKVMSVISWAYHNVEVWNREVTALAAFRMAREAGHHETKAIDMAHDLTWAAHFDYSNSSRPRVMQGDFAKVALTFQSHQVNMWYRLFRDIHQSIAGSTPQAKKEARYQLAGIMGMMTLFGGVTGFFGYNVLVAIAGMAFDDDDDPRAFKAEMEGHVVEILGTEIGGMVLNGIPGHLTGMDLTSRVGMADFFLRAPDSGSEGREYWEDFLVGALGVVPSTAINTIDGFGMMMQGDVARGAEVVAPKVIKDMFQAFRYLNEGVLSRKGDVVLERDQLSPLDIIVEAIGFTPAIVAETYERMGTLKDAEQHVLDERRELMNRFALAVSTKDPDAKRRAIDAIRSWNKKPYARTVPITADGLTSSLKSRARNRNKREDGVLIADPELGQLLRGLMPDHVY